MRDKQILDELDRLQNSNLTLKILMAAANEQDDSYWEMEKKNCLDESEDDNEKETFVLYPQERFEFYLEKYGVGVALNK